MTQVNGTTESRKGKYVTYGEMKQIEAFKKLDLSNHKITDQLERSPQTINNAIHKGTIKQWMNDYPREFWTIKRHIRSLSKN